MAAEHAAPRRRSSPTSPATATLQRMLFDGGFAGIVFPKEYGGQGLTTATSRRSTRSSPATSTRHASRCRPARRAPRSSSSSAPRSRSSCTFPAILKGEELWMQFLSEPSGGSDVAGRADQRRARRRRVGHQRLEDLDDRCVVVRLGPRARPHQLGRAEAPWAHRVHASDPPARHRGPPDRDARTAPRSSARSSSPTCGSPTPTASARSTTAGPSGSAGCSTSGARQSSPYVTRPRGGGTPGQRVATRCSPPGTPGRRGPRPAARELVGEARTLGSWPRARPADRHGHRYRPDDRSGRRARSAGQSGTMVRSVTVAFEIAGGCRRRWDLRPTRPGGRRGSDFLQRQAGEIGGGTTEMARNVISERVLGMPRSAPSTRTCLQGRPEGPGRRPLDRAWRSAAPRRPGHC